MGKKLVNITINLPSLYDEGIGRLVEAGVLNSRSEAIRVAIREFLSKELNNMDVLRGWAV